MFENVPMSIYYNIKKHSLILGFVLSAFVVIGLVALIMGTGSAKKMAVFEGQEKWTVKQKETFSRLLKVPIIFYHDIDGKGSYAVTAKSLRQQFEWFRDNGVKVVPLEDLITRLENPKPYDGKVVVITFDDGYQSMYTKLLPLVREFGYPATLFVYTDFVSDNGAKSITWENLRIMQKSGIDIQCHTQSHVDLVKLSARDTDLSREKMFRELYLSRKKIEQKLGKKVDLLAFPFGYYDNKTIQLAENAGYRRVFSTDDGLNPVSYNNYCLRRHHIKRNYTIDIIARIIE
jgi:peptidoglycan/xylan/chitin deacetylase (PgdA/CDA1 family)